MPETFEKLGIELSVKVGGDLDNIIKKLQKALNSLDVVGLETRIKSLEGKMKGFGHTTSDQFEVMARLIDKPLNKTKELYKIFQDSTAAQKGAKGIKDLSGATAELDAKAKLALKSQVELGDQIVAIQRNTKKALNETEQAYVRQGNAIQAVLRNTAKAEADAILARTQPFVEKYQALQRQGFTLLPDQKSYVRKTAIQDVDQAWVAAKKENEQYSQLLPKIKEYEQYMQSLRTRGQAIWNGQIVSTQEYNQRLRDMNGSVNTLGISFRRLAGFMAEFYSIRTVMFAIAGQIRSATSAVLDLNQAVHDTAAISGESLASVGKMSQVAMGIATTSKFTAEQVMKTTQLLAQAGVDAKDLPMTSKAAVTFATGANATPEQAVKLMTTAMNVWDLKASQSARVTNALTAALNESKLEAGGLSTAMNYLASTAESMGMSMEQTLGIIASMSQKGIRDSTIGTGMSQLLGQLAAPKANFKKLLDANGISADAVTPLKNDFIQVVAELEKADLKADEIYKHMDKQVARALIAVLNVGSEGFRDMTAAITGTDAALVANMKAMEGTRAKMNQVKQEFVASLNELGDALSGAFGIGIKMMRSFAMGVGTDGGKVVLTITSIGGAVMLLGPAILKLKTAIMELTTVTALFTKINPWVAAVTVGLTAAAGALAYFGNEKRKQKETDEAFVKGIAQEADKLQQMQRSLAEYKAGLKGTATTKEGYLKLTNNQKIELGKLINMYPAQLKYLDLERLKTEDLNKALKETAALRQQNSAKFAGRFIQEQGNIGKAYSAVLTGNNSKWLQDNLKALGINSSGDPFKDFEAIRDNANASWMQRDFVNRTFKQNAGAYNTYKQASNTLEQQVIPYITTSVRVPSTAMINGYAAVLEGLDGIIEEAPTRTSGMDKYHDDSHKGPDYKNAYKDLVNRLNKATEEAQVAEMRAAIDEMVNRLKDTTGTDFANYRKLIEIAIDDLRDQEKEAFLTAKHSEIAGQFGGVYDAKNAQYLFKGNPKGQAAYVKDFLNNPAALEAFRNARDAGLNAIDSQASKKKAGLPDADPGMYSAFVEKQADQWIKAQQMSNALAQRNAKTAQEVHDLKVAEFDIEIRANQMKEAAYVNDIRALELKQESLGLTSKEEQQYWLITEKLGTVRYQMESINLAKSDMAGKGFWGDFKTGIDDAVKAMGTMQQATRQLGSTVTNDLANGVSNAFSNMTTAMSQGKSGWVAFRDTMRQVIADILKELTKYIIKMFIVAAVQRMVGLAVGVSGSSPAAGEAAVYQNAGPGSAGAWAPNGIGAGKWAEGGMIPLDAGIRGVDSVPALLMPGEVVIRESAVQKYGVDYFLKHNAMKFASGGVVGRSSGGSNGASEDKDVSLTIINVVDPRTIPKTTGEEILNVIAYDAAKEGPTYKQLKAKITGGN